MNPLDPIETFYHFAKRAHEFRIVGPISHMFSDVSRDDEFPKECRTYREYYEYISEKSRYNYLVMKAFEEAYAFYLERRVCM